MTLFISWYILITALGWLTFPLAHKIFINFADRGYSLSRVLGLLIGSYLFWIFTSIGITQNDSAGIVLVFFIPLIISAYIYQNNKTEVQNFIKTNLRLIFSVEILFLFAFAFLALVRAANPEILGTEKPMELAFINAVMRSPTFPPRDPWLSGYAISYYHFGYIITGMIAKFTSTPATSAFNLMIALIFALASIGSYGILYNLLSSKIANRKSQIANSFLAPLFLLIVSNIEGLFHVLYTKGLFRSTHFWTWLNLKDMTTPAESATWIPTQFWWWWRASRVIYDSDLLGNHQEIIDEFPFFSFLLGDLHPHVLAIPFGLFAIAFAYHIYLGASGSSFNLRAIKLHLSPLDLILASLILGGLAFLNTWDILIMSALLIGAYLLARINADGWRFSFAEDLAIFALPLALISYILFLPFHLSFSSQAGGILPNLINPTRGAHLWMMFAPLFVPIFGYLFYLSRRNKKFANWKLSFFIVICFTIFLWDLSWLIGWLAQFQDPIFITQYLQSQGVTTLQEFFKAASLRKLESITGLLTLLVILIPTLAHLFTRTPSSDTLQTSDTASINHPPLTTFPPSSFILLLTALAALLVLGPEFLYLRDQFGTRMNTIFKFYYQAWMLWSIVASYGLVIVLQNVHGLKSVLYRIGIGLVLFSALIYPVLSILNKTNNFKPYFGFSLNDFDRVERENPDEAAGMKFLKSAPYGIVAEAVGGSYSGYARISTYTGLPTVLGWPGHENQWRGGGTEQGTRQQDIETLYQSNQWDVANEIIQRYNIRYIYVGNLERTSMTIQEEKFSQHLKIIFQSGTVTIYETFVK